jgi:hypothetical protein
MRIRTLVALILLGLGAASCERKKDEGFAGNYVGDGIDSQDSSNRKEFRLTLGAADSTVAGTYRIKAIILDVSGIVSGTLNGSALSLTLTPSGDECPYRINGTWSGDRITGSYEAFNCFVRSDGTLDLEKK